MRSAETWRDACAHNPPCQTEGDCNAADARDASNGATQVAKPNGDTMPSKPKQTDTAAELKRANITLREKLQKQEEDIARLIENNAALSRELTGKESHARRMLLGMATAAAETLPHAIASHARRERAETLRAYAAAAVDIMKLGGFPALESIGRTVISEMTVIAREITAERMAGVEGVASEPVKASDATVNG